SRVLVWGAGGQTVGLHVAARRQRRMIELREVAAVAGEHAGPRELRVAAGAPGVVIRVVLVAVDPLDVLAAGPGRPLLGLFGLVAIAAALAVGELELDRLAVDVHDVAADLDGLALGGDHA